jgi:hypothetical protein
MKTIMYIVLSTIICIAGYAQPIPTDSLYLGQVPPGHEPKVFVLPINGILRPIERITISNDGKEIYFGQLNGYPPPVAKIFCYKYIDNRWQGPTELFSGCMAPALSPDDSIMFMEISITYDRSETYYSRRTITGWSTPQKMFYFSQQSHYAQSTIQNNVYISTNFPGPSLRDVGKILIAAQDTSVISIGMPVSSPLDESDFFIARDESYIIHARHSPGVASDLLISYKKSNGVWTNSKSLGSHINYPSPTWDYGPFVTQDNKYLFFSRGGNAWNSYLTYWCRIDNIIDSLKYTNYVPYVKNQIPNQTDTAGKQFVYTIPDSTFVDDDGNNTLSYSATLSSGAPLPAWLSFDSTSRTFSGVISPVQSINIKVTAIDTANASATGTFTLNIIQHIGLNPVNKEVPNKYTLLQNYPNPFNPSTSISFDIIKQTHTLLKVYDVTGRLTVVLVNESLRAGSYKVELNAGNLSSGVYFYKLEADNFIQTRKMVVLK